MLVVTTTFTDEKIEDAKILAEAIEKLLAQNKIETAYVDIFKTYISKIDVE
jgi:hypothetical protein